MKKIRIGNDIRFRWQIRRGESTESFEGKDISVVLRDQFGKQCAVEYAADSDGVITGVVRGKEQKRLGVYTLTLTENDGKADMATVDRISVWQLVAAQNSSLVDDASTDNCGNVSVEVVELSSEIGLGGTAISVDTELNENSPNAVANSAVTHGINAVGEMSEEDLQDVVNGESASPTDEEDEPTSNKQNVTRKSGLQYYTSLLKSFFGSLLETKADKSDVSAGLDVKADKTELDKKTTLDEVKTKVQNGEWLPLKNGDGENSLVGGNTCSATGQYAVASGLRTTASGLYSHAEGVFSVASGNYSHAEGSNAKPKGEYSHAEGERTEVASQGGHAEGVCTYLNGDTKVIHHVGVGYYNDKLSTDVTLRNYGQPDNGYKYLLGVGGYTGKDITSDTKSVQEVFADHELRITDTEGHLTTLNDSVSDLTTNVGDQSQQIKDIGNRFASYVPTSAKGTANGVATLDGKGQVPVSQLGNIDTEIFIIVSALPTEDVKTNKVYLVPGDTTEEGNVYKEWVYVNNAWEKLGEYKPEVDLSGYSTTEEIKKNLRDGLWMPIKQGKYANGTYIKGAIAVGEETNANEEWSYAEGKGTKADGKYSHAEGGGCNAKGYYSHAEGSATVAQGVESHAECNATKAIGHYSHAEGYVSIAQGNASHAEGSRTLASGANSHAEGYDTKTLRNCGHAEGRYNYYDIPNCVSSIGIGDSDDNRLNARVVIMSNGQPDDGYIYILGIGGYGGQEIGSAKSLQEIVSDITTKINSVNATRLQMLTVGGSTAEYIPIVKDGSQFNITQKKRLQTFSDFTNLTAPDTMTSDEESRRSWIAYASLRNFHGTTMKRMFYQCGGIRELDTSTWDTENVTTMRSAFHGCQQLAELDVAGWDTHSLTDLGYAFYNCRAMKSFDTRAWDTSAVTSMDGVFNTCTALTELDLKGWDTSQVQTVDSMFNGCGSLRSLDIRYWDLSRCSAMDWFLNGCGAVEELYVGEGFGKVLNAVGTIDLSALTKWTGDSVQTLLNLYNRTADSSRNAITLKLSSQTKAALGTSGIQTLASRGYTIA